MRLFSFPRIVLPRLPRLPGWAGRALGLPEVLAARIYRSVLALPLASAGALAVVAINELSYERSLEALASLQQRSVATVQLETVLRRLVDAETGLSGYLLTERRLYLAPYQLAATDAAEGQRWLRGHHRDDPVASTLLATLATHADAALADMARALRAFDSGEQRLPHEGPAGRQHMDAVRALATQLMQRESQHIAREREALFQTLRISRLGVNAAAALSILALLVVLRQTATLAAAQRRHARALQNESDRLEFEVRRRTDDLTELAKHLQNVREDESSRLARVLHEELGALLTTAKLDIARMRGQLASAAPEVQVRLAHLASSIDSGITLKRRIIEDLRPLSLSNLGLVSALQLQLQQFAERSGLKVHSELQSLPLSDATQITVYRLVQESLTNIAKHARATTVTVRLQARGHRARLSVEDDGQGFDPAAQRRNAHGLMGMRYRVEGAQGHLHIHSVAGRGTRVEADLPLQDAAEGA